MTPRAQKPQARTILTPGRFYAVRLTSGDVLAGWHMWEPTTMCFIAEGGLARVSVSVVGAIARRKCGRPQWVSIWDCYMMSKARKARAEVVA